MTGPAGQPRSCLTPVLLSCERVFHRRLELRVLFPSFFFFPLLSLLICLNRWEGVGCTLIITLPVYPAFAL